MTVPYGSQSMIAPLRRVIVRRPDQSFAVDDPIKWHYTARPDLDAALAEHDALVATLQTSGAELIYHNSDLPEHADAIYVHDPAIVTDRGAIILRMGKRLRRGEEEAMAAALEAAGVPILYRLHGSALAEGGDLLWVDRHTLAVGQGFRTNAEGLRQLAEALDGSGVEIVPVPLPFDKGPDACLHLMSLISIVDRYLAVVYLPLTPIPFYQFLLDRGFRLVEVPYEEYLTMATNVLAVAPGQCLMLAGNPITKNRLEAAGCEVSLYRGIEISLKAEGGVTCLTRPIWRSD